MSKKENSCACKGIRICIVCENQKNRQELSSDCDNNPPLPLKSYVYCDDCKKAWLSTSVSHDRGDQTCPPVTGSHDSRDQTRSLTVESSVSGDYFPPHCRHNCQSTGPDEDVMDFPGIDIVKEFISSDEEKNLCYNIELKEWINSQSGRKKQDYGPQVNFKKKKLKMDAFNGLPLYSKVLVDRFQSQSSLSGFVPVELCNLEYDPNRGSAIDPHLDDCWVWGERLITVNLLSSTILTFTRDTREVLVTLPQQSLVVVFGAARYEWKHSVKREHITGKRLAMTFRELTKEFSRGGEREEIGNELVKRALSYSG